MSRAVYLSNSWKELQKVFTLADHLLSWHPFGREAEILIMSVLL